MGTKLHCKSYPPVYYSTSDLNKNANSGSWPQYYEDLSAGRYYDHFVQRPTANGYSERDKEVLKQAMLKHEIIFRNQVYELHRLYGIQKDFMDKLKREELHKYQVPVEASQSSPLSSQFPSEAAQKLWRIPQNQLASSSCSRSSTSDFNKMQSPMNFSQESSMNISPVPTHNKCSLMDCDSLVSMFKKCPIKKVDLQLPADEYLASEEKRQIEKEKATRVLVPESYPLKGHCRIASENDAGDGDPSCRVNASISEMDTGCKHGLADLNEEVQIEEATTAAPVKFIDPASCHRENQGKDFCSKPNSVFVGLSMDYLQNTWRVDMRTHQSDSCPGSSSVLSWIKPKLIPCVNPSASLSKGPILSIPNLGSEEENWHFNPNSRSASTFESKVFHQNGVFLELQSESNSSQSRSRSFGSDNNCCENSVASADFGNHNTANYFRGSNCMDVKSAKDMDLNLPPLDSLQVGMAPQQDLVLQNEGKNEGLPRGSPMLRMKPTCDDGTSDGRKASEQMGLDLLLGFSQHSTCKVGTEKVPTASSISASCAPNSAFKMIGVGDCPSIEKNFGFHTVNNLHVSKDRASLSSLSNSCQHSSEAVEVDSAKVGKFHTDLSCDLAKSCSHQQLSLNNLVLDKELRKSSSCTNYISSNSCTKDENVLSKTTTKKIPEIDLKVPVDPDTLEAVSTGEDFLRNQLEKCIQSSQIGKGTPQEFVKTAAEAIVVISASGSCDYLEDATCPSFEASPLHWFAEVITSIPGDHERKVCVDDDKLSRGMDYFESMTLKLTETKVDEYCPKHVLSEYPEEVTYASSFITQRSRGKGRRGGQQRNFQRDILPGFASLAKHEVSEDLEMLEGLMRSMGHSWQIGLARRNVARNGRPRGRGRPRSSNLIPAASTV